MPLPSHSVPLDAGSLSADLQALRAEMQVLQSSVAGLAAIQAQQTDLISQQGQLTTQQAGLAAQVAFLAGQSSCVTISASAGWITGPSSPAWSATYDAAQSVTTGSTAKLLISWSAKVSVQSTVSTSGYAGIFVEVLDGVGAVVYTSASAESYIGTSTGTGYLMASVGSTEIVTSTFLAANTAYTVRTRRSYNFGSGKFESSSLTVTKIGM